MSISLTIQSASLPVVLANSLATTLPRKVTAFVSGAVSHESTSGRFAKGAWSSASQSGQVDSCDITGLTGRTREGTGWAGSDTNRSDSPAVAARGGVKDNWWLAPK